MFGVSTGVEPIYDVNGFARTTKSLNEEDKVYMEYPEFEKTAHLGASLAFFENTNLIRGLCREVHRQGVVRFWLGDTLKPYIPIAEPPFAFLLAPYHAGHRCVGALGILGPRGMLYKEVFRLLRAVSEEVSEIVTSMIVKNRLSYRMPESRPLVGDEVKRLSVEVREPKLLP